MKEDPRDKKAVGKVTKGKEQRPAGSIRLRMASPKAIQVEHLGKPPKTVRRERIHRRRRLPLVKEGKEREFHSATTRVMFQRPQILAAAVRVATDDLALVTNTELAGPGQQQLAATVGEPSAAINGQVVLYTGNWYAARSADGGQTFQFIDPFTAFQASDPPTLGFCCDQVVNYISSIDTFVWLLQYVPKSGPEADNIQRLAFATTLDVIAGRWRLFDITTQALGVPGKFLDFPDLAVGANSLYVTTNIFTADGTSSGAAVVRIPTAGIPTGQITAQRFVSTDLNSLRVAQSCGTTGFFAAHVDTSTLRVFSWDETQDVPTPTDVGVSRWIGGQGYQSRTPDGRRWLDRVDPRITGAALAGGELWFAWSVDRGSNQRPKPFVQIARIDASNMTLIENINIFDSDSAIAYGALATNADQEVGISYAMGGGTRFPSHVVGILTGTRRDVVVAAGDRGPLDPRDGKGEWGDYLTVRPVFPDQKLFAATGFTLKGEGDGSNRDATPRFVVFGRAGGAAPGPGPVTPGPEPPGPVTPVPAPPVPPGPLPPTPPADGGPITDVNTLPIVSAEVAAKIKAAAGLSAGPTAPQAAPKALPVPPLADVPGTERWHVKTGQDQDRAKVGKNVIDGNDLGAGIVETTIEELTSLSRPAGLEDATKDPPEFSDVRAGVTEVTIWRIEATIIALKHEHDGDYHLVLQGSSGAQMVAEIPTPATDFVGDSPWLDNIGQARQEIDDKLVKHLSPAAFALMNDKYVPHGAMTFQAPRGTADPALSFSTPERASGAVQPLFATQIAPTPARITGVGFFDRAHGATGAAPNVIELHPCLKIEWL